MEGNKKLQKPKCIPDVYRNLPEGLSKEIDVWDYPDDNVMIDLTILKFFK